MPNPLRTLNEFGQSVWLDFVSRELLKTGQLTAADRRDGLRGVTSNPSIFEKAIGHGDDYDELIAAAQQNGDLDPGALFEELAIRDIQEGADALRPVYHQTQGRDGFISLEVSPYLAMKTQETIEEARRLWREVGRENLMVKVPGTKAGLPAIRTLIGEGININVTLLFSQQVYAEVADAYISGLEAFGQERRRPAQGRECRELFRQPHRHAGRRGARQAHRRGGRPGRKGAARTAEGQGRDRQRQARLSASIKQIYRRRALAAPGAAGGADASGCCGPAPAPRTRPTATCSMSTS